MAGFAPLLSVPNPSHDPFVSPTIVNRAKLSQSASNVRFAAEGYTNQEIADRLAISAPTVATYIRRIYEKLQVHSRAAAIGKFSSLIKGRSSAVPKGTKAAISNPLDD